MGHVVAYRLRADLLRRWRAVLTLGLLVALLGGIVLATAAGARRTDSAYRRLLDLANPPELLVSPPGGPGSAPDPFYEALADVPGVRQIRVFAGVPLVPEAGTPTEQYAERLGGIGVLATLDGSEGTSIGQPRIVSGRFPDPTRAEEILVSQRFAARGDLRIGDHLDVVLLTESETNVAGGVATRDQGHPISLTVTGIGVLYDEVVPFSDLNASGSIVATGLLAELVPRVDWNFEGAYVDTEPDADLSAMTVAIERLASDEALGTGGPVFVSDQASAAQRVDEAMRPLAVALAVAAAAFGLVAVLIVGQSVSRASREPWEQRDALRSVGMRPVDRVGYTLARAAVVGVVGAVGAVGVAVALSGRFPIGIARQAEPDPGLDIDATVLLGGAAALAALTVLSALPTALADLRARTSLPRASPLARAASRVGLSPAAVQGVRFATVGSSSRPVPARSTLIAVTVAITAVIAAVTFADSLIALLDTPSRYGQGWDRMVDAQFGPAPAARIVDRLESEDEVRGIAVGSYGDVAVDGVPVPAFDLESVVGEVSVTVLEGRAAVGRDEIVLGTETMDGLDVSVGATVEVETGDEVHSMRVTGRGVFPHMGQGSFSTTGLGIGAQLGGGSLVTFFDVEDVPSDYVLDGRTFNFVAIDLEGSPTAVDDALAEIEASVGSDGGFAFARQEQPPTKIRDLDRVRVVPAAMAAVLALVAVAALAHLLVTSVHERGRELALLRTLGFSRWQLRATVAWHATVITALAVIVGIPLGVATGRAVWRWFASGLHASAPAETRWIWLVVALLASLALANVVAAVPGRWAARTHPATSLRDQ